MAVEAFPELAVAPVVLEAADGEIARAPGAHELRAGETLTDRVEFGGPLLTEIDSSYRPDEADLQAFLRTKTAEFRFVLGHMSVNFVEGDPPLVRATVEVRLSSSSGHEDVIAFSLFPVRAGTSYESGRGFSLSPSLQVGPVTASIGSFDRQATDHRTSYFLLGGPELSSRPLWRFQRTRAQALVGPSRLVMVIQAPVGVTAALSVDLSAQVQRGVFRKHDVALGGGTGEMAKVQF
jgi:hypothetical protein